jgi:hypothetical protein
VQLTNNHHWNHFLALDADTIAISRFIEFAKPNYRTYSLELSRLLMGAAAEVDVVAKIACAHADPRAPRNSIAEYYKVLSKHQPRITIYPVRIERFGLKFTPWKSWKANVSPKWWTAHNKVKHRRDSEFPQANLKNALNAVAGLFVMLLHAFPNEARSGELNPKPQLFSIPHSHVTGFGPIELGTPISYSV